MRYDVEAKVYQIQTTPDGFGGETETLKFLYKIYCTFTAFGETEQSKKYGVKDKKYFKIITADDLPHDIPFKVMIGGHIYKPYSDREFGLGNRRSVMVERVD